MCRTKTRAWSLLLALVMVLGLPPGSVWAADAEVVQIGNGSELEAFRDRVNGGEKDLCAVLTADIELSGEWTPFNPSDGYVTSAYAGTFNGNGHTIRGVRIQDSGANGVGFFGTVNGAAIQNLQVEGTVTASNSLFVGGIVGKTQGAVTIENCSFSGTVSSGKTGSNAGTGGIAGRVNAGTVTITGCANSAEISGGCAGGILGYCSAKGSRIENCYNTGTISGSNRTGGIGGQVYSTTELTNCFTAKGVVCGFNGALTNCYDESNPPAGPSQLGSAFTTGVEGNVILSWQAGTAPAPKDPHIALAGPGSLYMTNSGPQPAGTLTVRYTDMDPLPVTWSILSGDDVISLSAPENGDANQSTQTVRILSAGKATVKAEAGGCSDQMEITVWPFVTTVEIEGNVAVGETVKAKINVLGGGELDCNTFPVTVQWNYKHNAADTAWIPISGGTAREFAIPESMEGCYLSFTYRYRNEDKSPGSPSLVKAAGEAPPAPQPPAADQALEDVLNWYTMYPVSGQDTNVNRVLERYLADHGFEDTAVSVKSVTEVYGGGGIAANGDITYFYADPNTAPAVKFGSYKVTFTLSKDGRVLEKEIPVLLYWDVERVKETMRREIAGKVGLDTAAPVTEHLTLPKVVDGKAWTLIAWTSSDEDAISISSQNQTTAGTHLAPYVGVVKRGETDRQVTLTAAFTFQLTNDVTGREAPILLINTYSVTVKALDAAQKEQIRADLLAKLEAGFAARGLTDAGSGEKLIPDEKGIYTVSNDIQLPTTRDFGVDGKYYPVVTTTAGDALAAPDGNNAARVEVLRPIGEDAEGTITVTLHDKDTSVTASKELKIKVSALRQEEIDAELALMERVKAAYFDGIKGGNSAKDNVRTDLSPFFEVYEGETGELVWVRTNAERTGHGIVPVPIEGWEDLELWRLFKSSNPNVICHENLTVTRQAQAKAVTITSYLSSETLGRYGELYRRDPETYARYAALAPLYYQEVTTDTFAQPSARRTALPPAQVVPDTIVVRGTLDPNSAIPVTETVDKVTFSLTGLDGAVWIPPATLSGLDESSTVYDVFTRMLTDNNCTATRVKGTYIKAISSPEASLSEKDYGEHSGWMYRVNGRIPEVYMGACPLHSGDVIQVFYTRDAKTDDPNWNWPSSGNTPSGGGTSNTGSSSPGAMPNQQTGMVEPSGSGDTYIITLPKDSRGPQLVTIPNVKEGQLVVIVYADGREEVIKKSVVEKNRCKILLEKDATVKVVDYANPFLDVDRSAWYASAVDFAAGRGLFAGVSGDAFVPDLPLSRGMLAAVLCRLESPGTQNVESVFSDVAGGAWYEQGVAWAAEAGIVSGYGDGRFGPDDQILREQLAVMLFRYARLLGMSTGGRDSLTGFSDAAAVSPWAQDAVAWAVDSGIICGLPNGTLAPSGTATRGEAAAMLQRFLTILLK